jgi:hypothetical protein
VATVRWAAGIATLSAARIMHGGLGLGRVIVRRKHTAGQAASYMDG